MPLTHRPKARHAAPRNRWRLALLVVTVVLGLTASAVAGLAVYGRQSIQTAVVEGRTQQRSRMVTFDDGVTSKIVNVLLVGTDDRSNLTSDERARMGTFEGRRSDTLILAQLEVGGQGAALLSFPRDLRVELCDGTVDKINSAMVVGERKDIGAESCLVQTISGHTGIEIDHYVEIDFSGFMGVIDALGGVTMFLEEPMIDRKAQLEVAAGCVTLDPEQALGFVRSRGYDDDFGRIQRQQRFLREVLDEVTDFGTLANPATLFRLVDRAADAVITDEDLGVTEMRELAEGFRAVTAEGVASFTVPGETAEIDGVSYVVEDEAEAQALYSRFQDSSVLRQAEAEVTEAPTVEPTSSPSPATDPTAVESPDPTPSAQAAPPVDVPPVNVLNTTTTAGLAGAAADRLIAAALTVAEVGNAQNVSLETTQVVHSAGLADAAARVAAALPGSEVREDTDVEGITVFLGSATTVEGLQAPTGSPTAAASSPASPTASEVAPTPTPTPTPLPTTDPTSRNAERPEDVTC